MTAGPSNKASGFALLGLMLLLTGGAVGAALVLSDYLQRQTEDARAFEEARLAAIAKGFVRSIEVNLKIPDNLTWVDAVAGVTDLSASMIEYVDPRTGRPANLRRILVLDPSLGRGVLPFTQPANGLLSLVNPLLSDQARVMIVSCTRTNLQLPVGPGVVDRSAFDALWNWTYDSTTRAAPPGWPAAWSGMGAALHVARIPLRSLFAPVGFKNVRFGFGKGFAQGRRIAAVRNVLARTTRYYLKGSLLKVGRREGRILQIHVVKEGAKFDLAALLRGLLNPGDDNAVEDDDDWEWDRNGDGGRGRWRWRGWIRKGLDDDADDHDWCRDERNWRFDDDKDDERDDDQNGD